MRGKGIDYFENSRRATHVQQQYAVHNPRAFVGYGQYFWGLTASDGPGWTVRQVRGVERTFFDYVARGVPYGPDDGTIAPWAVVASLPFAPEIVLPTVLHFKEVYPQITGKYCLKCSFNWTFPHESQDKPGWTSLYPLRDQPGACRIDVREPPLGIALATDEALPLFRHGVLGMTAVQLSS